MKKINIVTQATLAVSAGLLFTACSSTHEHASCYDPKPASYSSTGQTSMNEASGAQATESWQPSQSSQASEDRNEVSIPLHEEQVSIGKTTVDAGQVTIRKIVTTETVSQPVQLRRESLVIDREGAGAKGSAATSSTSSSNWQPGADNASQSGAGVSASAQVGSSGASASINEPAGASTSAKSSSGSSSSADLNSGAAFQEQSYTIRLQREEPLVQKTVVQTGKVVARKDSQMQQQTVQQQIRREDVQVDKSGAQNAEIHGNFSSGQINEPSGAQPQGSIENKSEQQDSGVNQSTDSTTGNRAPTQGQGVQDLKKQPEQSEQSPQ